MKFLTFILLLTSLGVQANPCAEEAKKYCQGIEPGKGQLAQCLQDYKEELSSSCAKELKGFVARATQKNPCFKDLSDYCSEMPADPKKIELCLLKHESRLSPGCSKDFKKNRPNLMVRDVCAQDVVNNCYPQVSGPEGSILKCLIKNKDKVSKHCKSLIDKRVENLRKSNPCFDDTEKFCPSQITLIDRHECLEQKISKLSPECKKIIQGEQKKIQANPCYKDLIRHCKMGINPQEQHRCLEINKNELSKACKEFKGKDDKKIKKMVEFCEKDRLKHCPKAPFQDGLVLKCLIQNKDKLSKQCAELL